MFHPEGPSFFELAEQALTSTTRGYDLLASKFDHTPFRTPDVLLEPLAEAAGRGGPIADALDACCGTGAAMLALRPLVTDTLTGVDLSAGMLAEAERRLEVCEGPGDAEVRFVQGDVMTMAFREEFDLITCCGAFGHILPDDQGRFLAGVHAALKPGGRFLFITAPMPSPTTPSWWLSRGFNGAMHLRNALLKPPFIMFYLTFPLERALTLLHNLGFTTEVESPYSGLPGLDRARLVIATKPS